ncbi:MAG: type II toxin-antitoxin system prevent-host-death family antitoxin [Alphaproteobacteria bacterium]|nr:type II toxin-antitoxin system prevent-host-death family antitoxin [Alphaproteobacteria bacterium]
MIREISAMEARKNFGDLLNEVRYLRDNIIIKKAGKPIAVLIDMALFEKISQFRPQCESLASECESLPKELQEAEKQ